MTANQWIKSPKGYVAIAMAAYLIMASIGSQDMKGIINGFIAAGVSLVVDILYCLIEKRKRIVPDGAVITGLIIALILSTTTSWPIVAATAAISILSKHLLVYKKKPIFNPAVVGLLLSILIFQTGQSWWGAFGDFPAWTIVFLVIGGYAVTNRVNKYPQVFSFLGMSFALLFLMSYLNVGNVSDALRPPFINATLFFGFFMLTDPPTSPAKVKDQIVFGIIAAVTGTIIYGFGGLMYLFIGLLIGNLYQFLKARSSLKVSKDVSPNPIKKANKMPVQ
jgi:Na+-translocating ferredoxin:NAD+ oxidoreductase RnfD subunit